MAFSFTAASSHKIEAASVPLTAAPVTVACWFNGTDGCVCSLADTGSDNNYFELITTTSDNKVTWSSRAGTETLAQSTTTWTDNVWSHACGIEASATDRRAFLNGGGKGTDATSKTPAGIDSLGIGFLARASDADFYQGLIAEVGIWNVALTDAEVAVLAAGYSPLCVQPQSLVFYAPLVRAAQDIRQARALTVTGASAANHPRQFYRTSPQVFMVPSTATTLVHTLPLMGVGPIGTAGAAAASTPYILFAGAAA